MAQSTENSSYFTLNHPSINQSKPKCTAKQSGLLNRRHHHASYLPQLELPSLPPLSQLLPADKVKKEANVVESSDAVAAAVAAGMIYPSFYNNTNDFNNNNTASFTTNNTANFTNNNASFTNGTTTMSQLMDPTPATDNFTTSTMMPLESMYNLPPTSTTNPTTMTTGYIKYEEVPQEHGRQRQLSNSSCSSTEKIYSFVAIPGTNQKKRPRRRYDEIERLYHCSWPSCSKAYGTLNHLNAHVSMQKHVS